MTIKSTDTHTPWADYAVTSLLSGKTYKVALRGLKSGESYCSCPDFRSNTLGTCKHIMKVAASIKRKFTPRKLARPYQPRRIAVHLRYDREVTLRLVVPKTLPSAIDEIVRPLVGRPIADVRKLLAQLNRVETAGGQFHIFPDAEEFIQHQLHAERMRNLVAEIRRDPARHPLRESLLNVPLLPYQLDGVAFVVGSGRAVLADDMGLGKTIQGVGVAELLAREAGIRKVLVICPASLKSQWRNEIHRFCRSRCAADRRPHRRTRGAVFAMRASSRSAITSRCCATFGAIEKCAWDLIVSRRGATHQELGVEDEPGDQGLILAIRAGAFRYTAGEPPRRTVFHRAVHRSIAGLGRGFAFSISIESVDEKGKVLGYKHLDELRQRLKPVLLRRTRDSVRLELPERTTEIVRIPPSDEQKAIHDAHMQNVAAIVRKRYLTEMDLLRLRMSLLMCRMSADATFLVTKEKPNCSTQARPPGRIVRRLGRRRRTQSGPVFGMDDDARPDRAAAQRPQHGIRAPGRLRAAERSPGIGPRVSDQSAMPFLSGHQRRQRWV